MSIDDLMPAQTSVAQVVGAASHKPEGRGSIPGQGTCLACGFGPRSGVQER